ncbi:isochorismate synthase [Microbacterium sp. UBA3486]|uniref:isochorismate synthase n=1 Tax=Microbacterium sp. UBA3486 TaxID=1946947 RepID=UPI0025E2EBC9|nr:isochorismate synthase [Microbacterium sp. UBA3486]
MYGSDDVIFHGRRRWHGTGRRAVLAREQAVGPGLADAVLSMLRRTEAEDGVRRIALGAIPFDPSQPAHIIVPEHVVEVFPEVGETDGSPVGPIVGASSEPAQRAAAVIPPDDPGYRVAVGAALRAIEAGIVTKVVLARTMHLEAGDPIDTPALFRAFAGQNPAAYAYHVPDDEGGVLVGASPELIAAVEGTRLRSLPLAGPAARHDDPRADDAARAALTSSAKDRHEHAVLVSALAERLRPFAPTLAVPAEPVIVETPRLWHLGTPIEGELLPGATVLEVAAAVHPTPAVCGTPTAAARDLIRILEPEDRGLYAGLVGWMDSSGDGEWALALRGIHVSGTTARLHAGAGIVAGSDPVAEHRETAAKLGSALRALAAVTPVRRRSLAGVA